MAAGCGVSAAQVAKARSAVYDTQRAQVWQAVSAEVKARYGEPRKADPEAGIVWSSWAVVREANTTDGEDGMGREERTRRSRRANAQRLDTTTEGTGGEGTDRSHYDREISPQALNTSSGRLLRSTSNGEAAAVEVFQARVHLVGGPPWRVVVEGEAAEHVPGDQRLYPYERSDEPEWVQRKIDELQVGIHRRLERYAR